VVAVRLGAGERAQVERAAGVQGVEPSRFVREAALAASAVVIGRVVPVSASVPAEREEAAPVENAMVVQSALEAPHWVDGVLLNADRVDPELVEAVV
jgi:uncharacterized protein (DUF1778 family)